jgi:hypothetical protein
MANIKITDFPELVNMDRPNVFIPAVDSDDSTMDATGTNVKLNLNKVLEKVSAGYSNTSGFAGRPSANSYNWEAGVGINYTLEDVAAGRFKVFSLDPTVQAAVDNPYWTTPDVSGDANVGLFNGYALPEGVSSLFEFDYDYDTENAAITHQFYALNNGTETGVEGSTGRIRLNDLKYGDQLRVRFAYNVIPQIANTTIEVAVWYANRNTSDEITFTDPLTMSPSFYGTGSVGKTFLNRPEISAWVISDEDVNALALPAIKADNPVIIQPLGLFVTIIR